MNAVTVVGVIALYFVVLLCISWLTSRKSDSESFFTGDRKSPWFIVAYGMIGAALSGVTFVSLPGAVLNSSMHFAQFILGNIVGYLVITFVLIPLYYRYKLVSIYGFLGQRFGENSYKVGSFYFLLSQSFGAALRMLLALVVMREIFNDAVSLPVLALIFMVLIYAYTYKSGIKTIVWTDMLQTTFLLLALLIVVFSIVNALDLTWVDFWSTASQNGYAKVLGTDPTKGTFFLSQFVAGFLIAIAMMGLDQNMMQKSLTIAKKSNAQKNTMVFSLGLGFAQLLFLVLGAMLYIYAHEKGLMDSLPLDDTGKIRTDRVFPFLAVTQTEFGIGAALLFVLGITAAAFSSADSALTALTTSFCYDFLKFDKKKNLKGTRTIVHIAFSAFLLIIIVAFSGASSDIFSLIFKTAGYTYSPLLGLFVIGICTKIQINDKWAPIACILAPILTFGIVYYLKSSFAIDLGFLPILIGSLLTIALLLIIPKKK